MLAPAPSASSRPTGQQVRPPSRTRPPKALDSPEAIIRVLFDGEASRYRLTASQEQHPVATQTLAEIEGQPERSVGDGAKTIVCAGNKIKGTGPSPRVG